MLDDMHKRKIDMADEIFVINKDGYIGSSTKSEIEYAIKTGKTVNYMEKYYKAYEDRYKVVHETTGMAWAGEEPTTKLKDW